MALHFLLLINFIIGSDVLLFIMRRFIYSFSFLLISCICFGQQFSIVKGTKQTSPSRPISGDMTYSAIINSSIDKKDLIRITKGFFIEEDLADIHQLETINYDDNLSEYKLRLGFRHGQYLAKGPMGARYVEPPVYLHFDAIFAFNKENQMQVTFTNFDSDVYTFIDDDGNIGYPLLDKNGDAVFDADKAIQDEAILLLGTETSIGKFLLWANSGIETSLKASRGEFRKSLKEQFDIYENGIKNGSTRIVTKDNIKEYNFKYAPETYEKLVDVFIENNYLFSVTKYRWDTYFEENFNYFFGMLAHLVSGTIEAVAIDGEIKYHNIDGLVLPVNTKERIKWVKDKKYIIFQPMQD